MSRIIQAASVEVTQSTSPIGFAATGGGHWPKWDRYLTVNGKHAYNLGNICDTCAFFFERMEGATAGIDVGALSSQLEVGVEGLDMGFVSSLANMMPDGRYQALLLTTVPQIVKLGEQGDYFIDEQQQNWGLDGFWGLPDSPKVPYYRGESRRLRQSSQFFEFLIPMFPRNWLDERRLEHYQALISKGQTPTAVAVSVLDIKAPAEGGEEHWCLAHYILDGHHKLEAAARANKPLTLVSFLALEQGVSTPEDQQKALEFLGE
jgi:hypothetical protein